MFLRQKLQNEDSSFKILPQKRLSMGKRYFLIFADSMVH